MHNASVWIISCILRPCLLMPQPTFFTCDGRVLFQFDSDNLMNNDTLYQWSHYHIPYHNKVSPIDFASTRSLIMFRTSAIHPLWLYCYLCNLFHAKSLNYMFAIMYSKRLLIDVMKLFLCIFPAILTMDHIVISFIKLLILFPFSQIFC
jgi:hypothetical protein